MVAVFAAGSLCGYERQPPPSQLWVQQKLLRPALDSRPTTAQLPRHNCCPLGSASSVHHPSYPVQLCMKGSKSLSAPTVETHRLWWPVAIATPPPKYKLYPTISPAKLWRTVTYSPENTVCFFCFVFFTEIIHKRTCRFSCCSNKYIMIDLFHVILDKIVLLSFILFVIYTHISSKWTTHEPNQHNK